MVNHKLNNRQMVDITNTEPVGTDRSCSPVAVHLPIVLVEDCLEQIQWLPEPMDYSSAARLQAMASVSGIIVRIITVPLILPAAEDVNSISNDLDQIAVEPVRLTLQTPGRR